jgi:hypothetical protein
MRMAAENTPTETSPVAKGFTHQAPRPKFIEAPTTLDDMAWAEDDPGATRVHSPVPSGRAVPSRRAAPSGRAAPGGKGGRAFIPSVSVMLLNEVGARDAGEMLTVVGGPTKSEDVLEGAAAEDVPSVPRPGGKRGGK